MTRRLSVLVVLTVAVLAAAWTFVGGAAAPVAPSGEWVGGYQVGSTRVVLHVTLGERGGRLVGSAATGIGARPVETALRAARFARGRLTLTLQDGTRLDGSVEGGAFRGIALANGNRGRFELLRERPAPDTALRPAVGAYRFAGGGVVALVTDPDAGGLRLVDYRNGALRRLSQLSRDRFVGGAGVSVPWPVRLTVELVRGRSGHVVGLELDGRKATRVPLLVRPAAYANGDVRLAGKLVRPPGPGPFPAVVLVPGSVPATRDTYDLWGYFFASHGLAVLSYDKRGVGASTGRYVREASDENLRDLAGDAVAGVAWLRQQHEIDPRRLGLSGGSQAGWVIPLAASRSSDVAFATLQSGPVMSVGRQEAYSRLTRDGARVPPPTRAEIAAALEGLPDAGYDPRPALESLRIPMLWQLGGADKRAYTPETLANLAAISSRGGHRFTVRVYRGAAHSLRATRRGLAAEELRAPGFVRGVFGDLGAWLSRIGA